uniref:Uncharacterized protein n=1 Tax=Oryza sativa subsp. japonica TaxID=39947 RepID=Q7XIP1_ORYSJ|nr:unknown protein [Oryza sativa Japonica Group]
MDTTPTPACASTMISSPTGRYSSFFALRSLSLDNFPQIFFSWGGCVVGSEAGCRRVLFVLV